jgi:predicted signal transduction protein with EAL and GGDEF domain
MDEQRMDEQVEEIQALENEMRACRALAFEAAPGESGEQGRQELKLKLADAVRSHDRVAVIVLQVNPNYSARAPERVRHALEHWQRARAERLHALELGCDRFGVVIAPVGIRSQARAQAERLLRALDPRICPLLRRALPYAWFGLALHPDDGADTGALLVRAEQNLEQMRRGPARRIVLSRRRPVGPSGLRPLALR